MTRQACTAPCYLHPCYAVMCLIGDAVKTLRDRTMKIQMCTPTELNR